MIDADRLWRLMPLSGIVAVVLQVVGYLIGGWSGYRPRGADAAAIFSADPGRIELGALIGGFFSLVFLVAFVGSVAGDIRRRAGDERLASIALGGGLTVVVALAIGYRFLNAAAFQAAGAEGISGEMAAVMFRLYTSSFAGFVSFGLAALMGATGLAALRGSLLPAWLAWTSLISAVGLLTPLHGPFEGLALGWIVVVSILLYRSASPETFEARNADRATA